MTTIANKKGTNTVQLEFQGLGKAESSVTLMQPLLGDDTASYTVEVQDFQCSLDKEFALKEGGSLFIIVARPLSGSNINMTYFNDPANASMNVITRWENSIIVPAGLDPYVAIPNDDDEWEDYNILKKNTWRYGVVSTANYYSPSDFMWSINHQVFTYNQNVNDKHLINPAPVVPPFSTFPAAEGLSFGCSPSGQFVISGGSRVTGFWSDRMLLISPLLQSLTDWPSTLMSEKEKMNSVEKVCAVTVAGNFSVTIYDPLASGAPYYLLSGRNESVWELFDRRKKIRIDMTIPIGLTLAWKDTKESTRYILQEFDLPNKKPTLKFNSKDMECEIRDKQFVGLTNFMQGGGKMAVKNLFPGQMQTIRLSIVLVYDEWDYIQNTWVEKEKVVDMSAGDFYYLKLTFSKETV